MLVCVYLWFCFYLLEQLHELVLVAVRLVVTNELVKFVAVDDDVQTAEVGQAELDNGKAMRKKKKQKKKKKKKKTAYEGQSIHMRMQQALCFCKGPIGHTKMTCMI